MLGIRLNVDVTAIGLFFCIAMLSPAAAFCVNNDSGRAIKIDATTKGLPFNQEIANNTKVCCDFEASDCTLGYEVVDLFISSTTGVPYCSVTVSAKGHVDVTELADRITCHTRGAG